MQKRSFVKRKAKIHGPLNQESFFRTQDGKELKSLKELSMVMEHLADEVFNHHVSNDKNDFANWIKDVIKDENLAKELMSSFDKHGHQKIMMRHIVRDYVTD